MSLLNDLFAEAHDEVVAAISHLPHLVAAALAGVTPEKYLPHAARGWSDSTRIAGGDPELWRQIFSQNRENVLSSLATFQGAIAAFRKALETGDSESLIRLLKAGKHARDTVAATATNDDALGS